MAKPFKFRYVNEIVGTFVLLIVGLLVAAVVLAGRAQDWFKPVRHFRLQFPEAGSLGVQKDAEVKVLEYTVGKVERLSIVDGKMIGDVTIKGDFISLVRADSKVRVKLTYNVAGSAFIDITEGQGPELEEGAILPCDRAPNLIDDVQQLVANLATNIMPMIASVNSAVTNANEMIVALNNPTGEVRMMLANLRDLSGSLTNTQGPVGMLLNDQTQTAELKAMIASVSASLQAVEKLLATAQSTVSGELDALPGTVDQARETLRETEKLLEGLQKHWLLRGSMGPPEPGTPLGPGEVVRP